MKSGDSAEGKAAGSRVWTESVLGLELHVDGVLVARVRSLPAGGATAQWFNGLDWDVSDQLAKVPTNKSRTFKTEPEAKAAVEARLDENA